MLRNPVDVMYSLHSQQLYNGRENIADFRTALDAEMIRKQGLGIPKGCYLIEGLFYREIARYTQQVKRYLDTFGKEKVHIIIFDDFKRDTTRVYRQTLRFLDVDPNFQLNFELSNANKRMRSAFLQRCMLQLPGVARWLGRKPSRSNFWRKTYRRIRSFNVVQEARPALDLELKRCLQVEFAPEMENLSQLLGRDLMHWCKT